MSKKILEARKKNIELKVQLVNDVEVFLKKQWLVL